MSSAASRPRSTGAATSGAVISVIAGLLLVISQIVLAATDHRWTYIGTAGRWLFGLGIAAAIVFVVVAVVALVSRGAFSDVVLLGATGWVFAWTYFVGPDQLPYTIDSSGEQFGTGQWFAWGTIALWIAIGVAALLLLIGIATTLRTAVRVEPVAQATGATGAVAAGPGAGWHPDPAGTPGVERWWDGTTWTAHTR
ncbi:DUF2510 domain-containing protein [Patulibacter sp. NPDC049589]|uniref:DUF2510 domain-containing protein n=1 Tax=Patulibacter sp. NPDC049589 TaxID=3154731 RepID=UPI003414128A